MFDPYNMKTKLILQKSNNHWLQSAKNCCLLIIACLMLMQASSQTDKRLIMADEYFSAGDYYTAANLYEQFLHPAIKLKTYSDFPLNARRNGNGRTGKYASRTDIIFKQAESYRLANYRARAAGLYKECFDKDSAKYADALYWYAVCQRSIGNYSSAEESIHRFLKNFSYSSYQQEALKELQTLEFIQTQLSKPDSVLYHVQKLNAGNNDKGVFAPVANGNQFLFTSTQTETVPHGANPYYNRLFASSLTNEILQNSRPLIFESLDSSFNQGTASISADGNHLYFTQWKKENGTVASSIYISTKTTNGWGKPQLLPAINQQGHNSKQPFCSADGRYLFFASDRSGGKGGFDIWYAVINDDGTTGEPANAGAVNTSANEQAPFYHEGSSTLVFSSDRLPGMGGYDFYMSKRTGTEWKTPENMGYPVNSSRDDIYFFTAEKENLLKNAMISSDRGAECCLATYTIAKAPKKKMITGVVVDCNNHLPLEAAEVTMKEASGTMLQTTSNAQGKYSFELNDDANQHHISIKKENYTDKSDDVLIESINDTYWQTDTMHNASVCLEKKFVLKIENVVTVYFDFDKSNLKERGTTQMDSIYHVLIDHPTYTLQISGYTDGKGSVEYNKKLSDRRAKSCADYLIEKGIDSKRISFESFGACCPVEMEMINGRDNPDGRSMNRRALININKE